MRAFVLDNLFIQEIVNQRVFVSGVEIHVIYILTCAPK